MNLDDLLKTKAAQDPRNRPVLEAVSKSQSKGSALGGVGHTERKRVQVPALVKGAKDKRNRENRVVVLVEIIRVGRKPTNYDNLVAGAKPLRDNIARSLGTDDEDTRLYWRYTEILTQGPTGTIVRIERLQ